MRRLAALISAALLLALPASARADAPATPAPQLHAQTASAASYTDLLDYSRAGRIVRADIDEARHSVRITLRDGSTADIAYPVVQTNLAAVLAAGGAQVYIDQHAGAAPWLLFAVFGGALLLLVIGLNVWARRARTRAGRNGKTGGPLRKDAQLREIPAVRFDDVAGCDEAVEELAEALAFLSEPERFLALGARMPSGVILYGPPGTGKTLLAKALAGEAGLPFFPVSGSEFVERYVGVGASRVRDLFARARAQENGAVIFIDEIDAIGRRRSAGDGAAQETEQTLNQILVELDGFNGRESIICIAATNRLDILDPALLRPGRFGMQIRVDAPNRDGRLAILGVHSKGKPLGDDVDLAAIAEVTAGLSGAQLADMLNQAAIMAAREHRDAIAHADLKEGQLRVLAGPKKRGAMMAEGELRTVAYHEAGHVLCAELCTTHEKAQSVTVEPRGRAAGLALYGREDRALHSVQYLHEQMVCALGGRAAEQIVMGTVSSGASNDLERVNEVARQAVEAFGFSPRVGQIVSRTGGQGLPLSERTRSIIDEEVERIVADAYRDALSMLAANRAYLDRLAEALQHQAVLERVDIAVALDGLRPRGERRLGAVKPDMGPTSRPALRAVEAGEPAPAPRREARRGSLAAFARWWADRPRRVARDAA